MVDSIYIKDQLKKINFDNSKFNRPEVEELTYIIQPDEQIYECVNGFYDGGFALLAVTDIRLLLIDKKMMGFLNVEDLRYDMISDIDYSHRSFVAQITVSSGMKTLKFKSYDQRRLRKLINHVQTRMCEIKKSQTKQEVEQKNHLAEINQQLQLYLYSQQQILANNMNLNNNSAFVNNLDNFSVIKSKFNSTTTQPESSNEQLILKLNDNKLTNELKDLAKEEIDRLEAKSIRPRTLFKFKSNIYRPKTNSYRPLMISRLDYSLDRKFTTNLFKALYLILNTNKAQYS